MRNIQQHSMYSDEQCKIYLLKDVRHIRYYYILWKIKVECKSSTIVVCGV